MDQGRVVNIFKRITAVIGAALAVVIMTIAPASAATTWAGEFDRSGSFLVTVSGATWLRIPAGATAYSEKFATTLLSWEIVEVCPTSYSNGFDGALYIYSEQFRTGSLSQPHTVKFTYTSGVAQERCKYVNSWRDPNLDTTVEVGVSGQESRRDTLRKLVIQQAN